MSTLLISPRFFGYEAQIQSALERVTGGDVQFFDERRSNTSTFRAVARLWPALAGRLSAHHFKEAIAAVADQEVDHVIVVKGEVTPRNFLDELRSLHPGATFTYYSFDSLSVSAQAAALFEGFDRRLTFDPTDAERFGMEELPLFHSPAFTPGPADRPWDVAFVGTIHSNRFDLWSEVVRDLPPQRVHGHFYVPARWYFLLQKARGEFRNVPLSTPKFTPLDLASTAQIFRTARSVLDVQRVGQTGMTMRTFEVLASGSGLITMNPTIRESPIYDPAYVLVAQDATQLRAQLPDFLRGLPHPDQIAHTVKDYSVDAWASRLLGVG